MHFASPIHLISGLIAAFSAGMAAGASDSVDSDDKVTIYSWTQSERLEADLGGDHGALLKIIRDRGEGISISLSNLARSRRDFEEDPKGCLFPMVLDSLPIVMPSVGKDGYRDSLPIERIRTHIIYRKGTPPASSTQDLVGKPFGVFKDMHEDLIWGKFDRHLDYIRTPTDKNVSQMLASGRVDYILGWIPDTILQLEKAGIRDYEWDPDFPLIDLTVHVTCKTHPASLKAMEQINHQIRTLQTSGKLRQILTASAIPVEYGSPSFIRYPITGITNERHILP